MNVMDVIQAEAKRILATQDFTTIRDAIVPQFKFSQLGDDALDAAQRFTTNLIATTAFDARRDMIILGLIEDGIKVKNGLDMEIAA